MTVATHEQQRDAVEAWARGRVWLAGRMVDRWGLAESWEPEQIRVVLREHDGRVAVYIGKPRGADGPRADVWTVSMPVALAWALLVELGADSVDAGKCQACVKRGGPTEWRQAFGSFQETMDWEGYWAREAPPWTAKLHWASPTDADTWKAKVTNYRLVAQRPCPACNGTGREVIPIARALLGDDPKVRACLHTEADRLLAANDPVGMALAWGLRWSEGDGNEDGTGEAVMLLQWAKVAREQAEQRDLMEQWAALLAAREHPDLNTIVLSPDAYAQLTGDTWTMAIAPAEEPAEVFTITAGLSVVDAIRPEIEALPEPINERDRPKHARHIGPQLGRRLGVRAR
jgi:hypothetical protein